MAVPAVAGVFDGADTCRKSGETAGPASDISKRSLGTTSSPQRWYVSCSGIRGEVH